MKLTCSVCVASANKVDPTSSFHRVRLGSPVSNAESNGSSPVSPGPLLAVCPAESSRPAAGHLLPAAPEWPALIRPPGQTVHTNLLLLWTLIGKAIHLSA